MVVSTTPVVLNEATNPKGRSAPARLVQLTSLGVSETPCVNLIEPLFYAVDLMLPVIPLHQETRCDVADGPGHVAWRWAKFAYSLAGKLVTTLALITFSGVFRNKELS